VSLTSFLWRRRIQWSGDRQSKSEFSSDEAERPDELFGAGFSAGLPAGFGASAGRLTGFTLTDDFSAAEAVGSFTVKAGTFSADFASVTTSGSFSSGSGFAETARTLFRGDGADT
jgi:organic hydroperoxide reductase OsmC/OhrA